MSPQFRNKRLRPAERSLAAGKTAAATLRLKRRLSTSRFKAVALLKIKWIFCLFGATASLNMLAACGMNTAADFTSGTYAIVSATLRSPARSQLIECNGDFRLRLDMDKSVAAAATFIKVQPLGASLCRSRNPSSFEESLGGNCSLKEILFAKKTEGTGYRYEQSSGRSWQCNLNDAKEAQPKDPDVNLNLLDLNSELNMQAFKSDTILLNHRSQGSNFSTEFVFKRVRE